MIRLCSVGAAALRLTAVVVSMRTTVMPVIAIAMSLSTSHRPWRRSGASGIQKSAAMPSEV